MSAPLPFYLLNAFAPTKHAGNQAAVVIFHDANHPLANDEKYMSSVANDFGYSETAFLIPLDAEDGLKEAKYGLRWFTPEVEIRLCGHGTLASAYTLFSLNKSLQTISFETRWSGTLMAKKRGTANVEIILPSLSPEVLAKITNDPTSVEFKATVQDFTLAAGIRVKDVLNVGIYGFEDGDEATGDSDAEAEVEAEAESLEKKGGSFIFELSPEVDLKSLKFDIKALLQVCSKGIVIVTQQIPDDLDENLRIRSRVFGPGIGVDEDSVTGSAHAYLTGYYLASPVAKRLPSQFLSEPKETIIDARQLSARGGAMRCTWDDGKAKLVGKAWEFARGTLAVESE